MKFKKLMADKGKIEEVVGKFLSGKNIEIKRVTIFERKEISTYPNSFTTVTIYLFYEGGEG